MDVRPRNQAYCAAAHSHEAYICGQAAVTKPVLPHGGFRLLQLFAFGLLNVGDYREQTLTFILADGRSTLDATFCSGPQPFEKFQEFVVEFGIDPGFRGARSKLTHPLSIKDLKRIFCIHLPNVDGFCGRQHGAIFFLHRHMTIQIVISGKILFLLFKFSLTPD